MCAGGRDRARERSASALRIAQVAPLYERVPPLLYGGTERVVAHLTDELVARGHDVTVFASGDSKTPARLIAPTARALRLDPAVTDSLSPHIVELAQVFQRAADFDVIHCHVDYLAFPFGRLVRTPTLHTLHGRLDRQAWEQARQEYDTTCLLRTVEELAELLRDMLGKEGWRDQLLRLHQMAHTSSTMQVSLARRERRCPSWLRTLPGSCATRSTPS